MFRWSCRQSYFFPTRRFFAEVPKVVTAVLREGQQSGKAIEPHSQRHNNQILETLNKRYPETQFIIINLPEGTILEGRDAAYSVEGAMPFSPPKTPFEELPKGVQAAITRADKQLGAVQNKITILKPIQAVANQEGTVIYVDPAHFTFSDLLVKSSQDKASFSFPTSP